MKKTVTYLVIDSLFDRYIILVQPVENTTSVYCEECEQWVAQYDGNQICEQSAEEFLGIIVDDHQSDFGEVVKFDNDTVSFK